MKQTTTEVITKLTIEYNELAGRIGSLERFIICADYQEVTQIQKSLLTEQHSEMEFYKRTLMKRLLDLRAQEKREKEMTKAPEEANRDDRIEPHVFAAMEYEAHRQKESSEASNGTPAD